jgi:hypothetical protein
VRSGRAVEQSHPHRAGKSPLLLPKLYLLRQSHSVHPNRAALSRRASLRMHPMMVASIRAICLHS